MDEKKDVVAQEVEATETDSTQEEQTTEEKVEEQKELIRQLKLKVDGKEEVMDLPFEVDEKQAEWLAAKIQPTRAAQKRFQEVSAERKTIEAAFRNTQKDPAGTLKKLGVDPKEFAQKYMEDLIREQDMTEEERRIAQAEKRVAELEAANKEREEAIIRKQQEEQYNASMVEMSKQITNALDTSGLPKTNVTQKRMAEYMMMNLQNGVELPMSSIVDLVREDYEQDLKEVFGGASAEQIIKLVGEDTANKIRKHDLAKLKSAPSSNSQVVEQNKTVYGAKEEETTLSPDAFREHLEKLKK